MNFTPVQTRKTGLGATTENLDIFYLIKKAIELGFLPSSYSQVLQSIYNKTLWTQAHAEAKGFVYPKFTTYLPACECTECSNICKVSNEISNLVKQSILQATGDYLSVYAALSYTLLYISVNELETTEQVEAEKILASVLQSIPTELQTKILGVQDTNIKYAAPTNLFLEGPARPTEDILFGDTPIRGTQPNERTDTMYATGAQSTLPKENTTQNFYVVAEPKTAAAYPNNYWWYVGGGVVLIGGIITTVVLLKPKKKKSKKRR